MIMKLKTLLLFCSLFILTGSASAGNWLTNLEQAKKLALSTDKLVLVDFWAIWCGPCKKMDRESWSDPEVQKIMQSYVPVKIDLDAQKKDSVRYNVRSIPYIFILDGNGEVVYQSVGYMDKAKLMAVLEKFALNTSFLKNEALSYYQHQNYVTSLRLAERYLDYTLYLEEAVKLNFLRLARYYLNQSEKMLSRRQDNFRFIKEKVELLELTAALYADNERGVQKSLSKTSLEDLDPKNRALYAYLNLCINQRKGSPAEVEKWSQVLEKFPASEKYFIKAELFSGEES